MNLINDIKNITNILKDKPDDVFLTTASFEKDRCLATADNLYNYSTRFAGVINFLSKTTINGEVKKGQTAEYLLEKLIKVDVTGIPRLITIRPYDYFKFFEIFKEELIRREIGLKNLNITIDVSCLTKIQLIFLIKVFILDGIAKKLRILYTIPDHYNTKGDKFSRLAKGYYEPIIIPIKVSKIRKIQNTFKLCLVITGHEGQRTICAWKFVEPMETILLFTKSGDELEKISKKQNEYLLNLSDKKNSYINKIDITDFDIFKIKDTIKNLLKSIRKENIRVSIIPFGPKPILIGILLRMVELEDYDFDIIYPIPASYNSNYSEGAKKTSSFLLEF